MAELPKEMREKYAGNATRKLEDVQEIKDIQPAPPRESNTDTVVTKIKDSFVKSTFEPIIKNAVMDIVESSLDNAGDLLRSALSYKLFGDAKFLRRGSSKRREKRDQPSYDKYYDDRNRSSYRRERDVDARREYPREEDDYFDWDTNSVIVATRGKGEYILDEMEDLIRRYGYVRLSDLYELLNKRGDYTYQSWGWTSLVRTKIEPYRGGGYIVRFPKIMQIN